MWGGHATKVRDLFSICFYLLPLRSIRTARKYESRPVDHMDASTKGVSYMMHALCVIWFLDVSEKKKKFGINIKSSIAVFVVR